jgi:hypothetical protein
VLRLLDWLLKNWEHTMAPVRSRTTTGCCRL